MPEKCKSRKQKKKLLPQIHWKPIRSARSNINYTQWSTVFALACSYLSDGAVRYTIHMTDALVRSQSGLLAPQIIKPDLVVSVLTSLKRDISVTKMPQTHTHTSRIDPYSVGGDIECSRCVYTLRFIHRHVILLFFFLSSFAMLKMTWWINNRFVSILETVCQNIDSKECIHIVLTFWYDVDGIQVNI